MKFRPEYLLAFALALPASAQPASAQTVPAWNTDKTKSSVGFTSSMGGAKFNGSFRRWTTRIRFSPTALDKSSVIAVIDMRSAATGDGSRDSAMPGSDWFFTEKFPTATYRATRFQALGGNRYMAFGTLTLRGATRPANLPFQLVIKDKQAVMQGSITLNRLHFGVGQGQFAGVDSVPANVVVNVSLHATRQP